MTLYELVTKDRGNLAVGTRIRLASGTVLLVGDINQLGGVCDDCRHEEAHIEVVEVCAPASPEPEGKRCAIDDRSGPGADLQPPASPPSPAPCDHAGRVETLPDGSTGCVRCGWVRAPSQAPPCEACEQLKLPVEVRWAMRIDHTCGKGTP